MSQRHEGPVVFPAREHAPQHAARAAAAPRSRPCSWHTRARRGSRDAALRRVHKDAQVICRQRACLTAQIIVHDAVHLHCFIGQHGECGLVHLAPLQQE